MFLSQPAFTEYKMVASTPHHDKYLLGCASDSDGVRLGQLHEFDPTPTFWGPSEVEASEGENCDECFDFTALHWFMSPKMRPIDNSGSVSKDDQMRRESDEKDSNAST